MSGFGQPGKALFSREVSSSSSVAPQNSAPVFSFGASPALNAPINPNQTKAFKSKVTSSIFGGSQTASDAPVVSSTPSSFTWFSHKKTAEPSAPNVFAGRSLESYKWTKDSATKAPAQDSLFSSPQNRMENPFGKSNSQEQSFHFKPSSQNLFSATNVVESSVQNSVKSVFTTTTSTAYKPPSSEPPLFSASGPRKSIFGGKTSMPEVFKPAPAQRFPAKRENDFSQDSSGHSTGEYSPIRKLKRSEDDSQKEESLRKFQGVGPSLFSQAIGGVTRSPLSSPLRMSTRRRLSSTASESSRTGDTKLMTPAELAKIKSILCKNIPPELNQRDVLLRHFGKFGQVVRLVTHPNKGTAFVHFGSHRDAEKAKKFGSRIGQNQRPVQLFWGISSSGKKKQSPKSRQRPSESLSPDEVKQEIEAMAGGSDIELGDMSKPERIPELKEKLEEPGSVKHRLGEAKSRTLSKVKKSHSGDVDLDSQKSLFRRPAFTAGERFAVLDARDKILRLERGKIRDMSRATAMKGTCPDMCPEKERYMREERRRLEVYEMSPSGERDNPVADHYLCVKEYSRSSADQEEPLPHELRPVKVLMKTMDFLLEQVANRLDNGSGNVGDLYTYLWDRTRSIRKDLTQQQACTLDSVSLVEKCARFHIHCAACLCEEELSHFDPKINDENLTKCLQTLKHMYYDLSIKDEYCPNEAEFMAYDVLLHLNDADILRQVQHLRKSVRESPVVRFAIQVFNALNNNNFVRFFKCVYNAPYLAGCVIHRYFSQVRIKALYTLVKAYCPGGRFSARMQYPMEPLINIMAFENIEECQNFCAQLGLLCDDKFVHLDRNNIIMSNEVRAVSYRAWRVLDSKRTTRIGEVLNGGPLPPFCLDNYTPHSSFDGQGYLRPEAYTAHDQDDSFPVDPAAEAQQREELSRRQELQLKNVVLQDISHEMINESVHLSLIDIVKNSVDFFKETEWASVQMLQEVILPSVGTFVREMIVEVFNEERQRQEEAEKRSAYLLSLRTEVSDAIVEDIICDMVRVLTKGVVVGELEIHKAKEVNVAIDSISDELIVTTTEEEIRDVAATCYATAEDELEKKIVLVKKLFSRFFLRFYFTSWKMCVSRARYRKNLIKSFPPTNPELSPQQQNELLRIGTRNRIITSHSPHNPNGITEELINLSQASLDINKFLTWRALPLMDLIPYDLSKSTKRLVYKFALLVGDDLSESDKNWCKSLFSLNADGDVLYTRTCQVRGRVVSLCLRVLHQRQLRDVKALQGTTGFIVFGKCLSGDSFLSSWMGQFLDGHPDIPSLCFSFSHEKSNPSAQMRNINLKHVLLNFPVPSAPNALLVANAIRWIFEESCPPPDLVRQPLISVLENFLVKHVITSVCESPHVFGAALNNSFPVLISHYNSLVSNLKKALTDESLQLVSWPPPELGELNGLPPLEWNSDGYLGRIGEIMDNLILPDFDMTFDAEWESMCDAVWCYYELVTSDSPSVTLKSRIEHALYRYRRSLSSDSSNRADWAYFWSIVFQSFMDAKLEEVPNLFYVHYFEEDLWELQHIKIEGCVSAETMQSFDLAKSVLEYRESPAERVCKLNLTLANQLNVTMAQDIDPELDETLQFKIDSYKGAISFEKEKSQQFTDYIKRVLQEGEFPGVRIDFPESVTRVYNAKDLRSSVNMRLDFDETSEEIDY